jgi:phosphoglycerate dehydrogenase-like enzyme
MGESSSVEGENARDHALLSGESKRTGVGKSFAAKAMDQLRIFVDFATPPDVLEMLRAGTRGHELLFPATRVPSVLVQAEADPQLAEAEIVFGQPDPGALLDGPRLKWVHISTSSITRYDTPALRAKLAERGIALTNSASVYDDACATHTLGFMIAQARQFPRSIGSRAIGGSDEWHALRNSCVPLAGQTVVIVGYGAIGERLTEMLQPFAMKISGYRRQPRGHEAVPMLTAEQLPQALATADHVINILPDSLTTRRFFDRARFAAIKPGATFYNIGRGATVDQQALLEALRSGRVAAAWLDVTEPEPLPGHHPLLVTPNCFITPHVAGGHADETKTLVRHFITNFDRFIRGEPLLDRVV